MKTDKDITAGPDLTDPRKALPWIAGFAAVSYPFFAASGVPEVWEGLVFLTLLLFPAMEDGETGYISDGWSLCIGAAGILRMGISGSDPVWGGAAAGFFLAGLYLWKPESLGEGDVWLGTAIGMWLTAGASLVFLWLSFVLGGLWGGTCLLMGWKRRADRIPFGPFLCVGGGAAYLFGERAAVWYGSFF